MRGGGGRGRRAWYLLFMVWKIFQEFLKIVFSPYNSVIGDVKKCNFNIFFCVAGVCCYIYY